ncbi:hypothetical protein JAAARDRAFT_211584 [Jaapia argillacea MUCL 33604]|uniref:Uncharacterized protein n=1 Tax=Jaapia argillacea MUCL 33604 TaxID=933084 RepID=A0A067P788_9AGAM|nr:hypothetical protein JAAARDRAFT_211584 [Jaapia argillacea MUCL 33604]
MRFSDTSRAPTSSPPSSPFFGGDSSPPSSPILEPMSLDTPPASPHIPCRALPAHPFAASMKATRPPRLHERKRASPPVTPEGSFSMEETPKKRLRYEISPERDDVVTPTSAGFLGAEELGIWDDAIALASDIDNRESDTHQGSDMKPTCIDLSRRNLTFIPHNISDLAHFVKLPKLGLPGPFHFHSGTIPKQQNQREGFSRVASAPAASSSSSRPFVPYKTVSGLLFDRSSSAGGKSEERHEIQLYLSMNEITALPTELFALSKLTVLTLRNNALTYIPPEIARLKNLRELNVANNQLSYLPAEMLNMSLRALHVHPNPFLPPPALPPPTSKSPLARSTRQVSPTTHLLPLILPLTELCLRVLISPPPDPQSRVKFDVLGEAYQKEESYLSATYEKPLHQFIDANLPHLRDILDVCVPGSVASSAVKDGGKRSKTRSAVGSGGTPAPTGIGTCPSPRHRQLGHSQVYKKPLFVHHAEERFTWEKSVAGVRLSSAVPVRWRGCARGCLNFLDTGEGEGVMESGGLIEVGEGEGNGDVDMDELEGVKVMNFSGGLGNESGDEFEFSDDE